MYFDLYERAKSSPYQKIEYLLDETVHCPGEEVAAVAAVTAEIAEEALKLIEVDYEVLPAIFDVEEAMKPNAPLAHQEYGTNIFHGTDMFGYRGSTKMVGCD